MKDNLIKKIIDVVVWFLGSWWGVIFHTIWFILWFVFDLPVHILTNIVSLEAIYIGIFLLMYTNEQDALREKKDQQKTTFQSLHINEDVDLDRKQLEEIKHIKNALIQLKNEIQDLKNNQQS